MILAHNKNVDERWNHTKHYVLLLDVILPRFASWLPMTDLEKPERPDHGGPCRLWGGVWTLLEVRCETEKAWCELPSIRSAQASGCSEVG